MESWALRGRKTLHFETGSRRIMRDETLTMCGSKEKGNILLNLSKYFVQNLWRI